MKKITLLIGTFLLGMFLMSPDAMAILLFPDLQFDSTGVAIYDASTGKFTITAESDHIVFDSSLTKYDVDSTKDDSVYFWAQYASGGDGGTTWYFEGDADHSDPDIVLMGTLVSPPSGFANTGTLIKGNIISMTYDNNTPGYVKGTFDITEGDLLSYYGGRDGQFLINLEFGLLNQTNGSVGPSGSGNDFNSLGAKGDIAPTVPEPTSMLLLGVGLIGLIGGKVRTRFTA